MIRFKRIPENTISLIPDAAAYLDSVSEIEFGYLFGGLARPVIRPLSDIDIAVHLDRKADMNEARFNILGRLIEIFGTDEIDLVILNKAPLPLSMRILANNKILVDKKPFARHAYESLTMRKYFDFSFLEKSILERRFLNG